MSLGVCNVKIEDRYEGVIQSPNFPQKYPPEMDCHWALNFGLGIEITINFKEFDVELDGCVDCLLIHKGENNDAPLLAKYSGKELPNGLKIIGPVSIYFRSDGDTEMKGFELTYSSKGEKLIDIL